MTDPVPGALALVGSGEYTRAMLETDRTLLDTVGGAYNARVVVLPTAAGLEAPASPARWARMGLEHFTELGAPVQAAMILNRSDAEDPRWLPMLEDATFYYFSGGNPQHVVDAFEATPAWEVISRRYLEGAVLAGCSAGAMAFGGWTPSLQGLRSGRIVTFSKALGIVPRLVVLPHFDRMGRFVPAGAFNLMLKSAPDGVIALGIDEDTALVRLAPGAGADGFTTWQVSGRQGVTVFDRAARGGKTVYPSGQTVLLPS